jgi:hypothetical protein
MKKKVANEIFSLPFRFCIVCAKSNDLMIQSFSHRKINDLTVLSKLAGNIGTLVEYFANKPIQVEGNFCRPCAQRLNSVVQVGQLLHLAMVVSIFITILLTYALAEYFGTTMALVGLGLGLASAIVVKIFGTYFVNKITPNFFRLTKKEAILKIPGKGKVTHSWNSGRSL